jgi:hypothetical protein
MIASRSDKPLFRVATLFIFFIFFCVNSFAQSYCSVNPTSVQTVHIRNVTIGDGGGIDKSTSGTAGGLRDYTGDTDGTVSKGLSYSSSITCRRSIYGNGYLKVVVDWNDDGDWDDANETIVNDVQCILYNGSADQTYSFTLNVPADAATETVRMRVLARRGVGSPCLDHSGEAEDYELVVSSSCSVGSASSSSSVAKDNAMTNITHAQS